MRYKFNSIVASDFDSNGYPDIVSAHYSGNDIRLFLTDVVNLIKQHVQILRLKAK